VIDEDADQLLPGQAMGQRAAGRVLATNSDSYPAVIATRGGRIVYCAFESRYGEGARTFTEGVLREVLGIRQAVRLTRAGEDVACESVMTRVIRDRRSGTTFLLALNTSPRRVELKLEGEYHFSRDLVAEPGNEVAGDTLRIAPYGIVLLSGT
jgi:beta-galactosidase